MENLELTEEIRDGLHIEIVDNLSKIYQYGIDDVLHSTLQQEFFIDLLNEQLIELDAELGIELQNELLL